MTPWGPPTTPIGVPAEVGRDVALQAAASGTPDVAARRPGSARSIVLTLSLLASKYVLDLLVDFEWPVAVYVALLAVIGYGPSIAWWWFASGRWGSGDRFGDVGATPRWSDLGWGPLIWLATILVQTFVGAIVLGFDIPLSNNTDDIGELSADRTYAVAIVIAAVIAAPLVEELVFRGLVMRSLLSKLPAVVAIGLQGVLFGVAHVDPVRGIGNIGLALILSGVGHLARDRGVSAASDRADGRGPRDLQRRRDDPAADRHPRPAARGQSRPVRDGAGSVAEQVAVVDQPHVAEPDGGRDPHRAPGDRSAAPKLVISVSVRASNTVVYSRSADGSRGDDVGRRSDHRVGLGSAAAPLRRRRERSRDADRSGPLLRR